MSVSFTRVDREVAKYELNLVGLQGVRWEKEGTVRVGDYIFLWKINGNYQGEQDCLYITE